MGENTLRSLILVLCDCVGSPRASAQYGNPSARDTGRVDRRLRHRKLVCGASFRLAHLPREESRVTRLLDVIRLGRSHECPCRDPREPAASNSHAGLSRASEMSQGFVELLLTRESRSSTLASHLPCSTRQRKDSDDMHATYPPKTKLLSTEQTMLLLCSTYVETHTIAWQG